VESTGADLDLAARAVAGEGAPVYAELVAEGVELEDTGDSAVFVHRWVYLTQETSRCPEPVVEGGGPLPAGVQWRAMGNEPFWAADVTAEGIRVVRPGEDTVSVPPVSPDAEGGSRSWRAVTEAHTLVLEIVESRCTDSMSGFEFDHSSRLVLDGSEFAGCARRGPATPD
ncbi:MAG: hypothetical protein RQ826_18130, partial [Xanthomonadales bacterium]|nr:hypothetical protein [Xanthomonadales bacterium]